MEIRIEDALLQGISAHKQGNLVEAEGLYRAILKSEPAHPDANHNLGLIAVKSNKSAQAIPLFKNALESNLNIEQFWLSYVEALIRDNQFDNAKKTIERG